MTTAYPWFINPRLMATLHYSFPDVGTIQQATDTQDARGQTIKTWANLAGHIDIPCRIEIVSGGETKGPNQVYSTATHSILLSSFYPLILPKMRFVDGEGVIYDITFIDQEAFGTFTNLVAEIKR